MDLIKDLVKIKRAKELGFVGLNDEFFSLCINKIFEEEKQNILIVIYITQKRQLVILKNVI